MAVNSNIPWIHARICAFAKNHAPPILITNHHDVFVLQQQANHCIYLRDFIDLFILIGKVRKQPL